MKQFIPLLFLLFIACQSSPEQDSAPSEEQNQSSFVEEESGPQLNNGQRWQANPETTKGIQNMVGKMKAFNPEDSTASYAILADSLTAEFQMIFQNCSMEGEAHDQLHNYLLPILGKFNKLRSDDLEVCNSAFEDTYTYLLTY